MRIYYSILLFSLLSFVSFSQEKKEIIKDTTTLERIQLDEIKITGNFQTDPVHSSVSNKYAEKIVQPKNVADLFNDINGFSTIKRGSYAIDPSFRAAQYEQLNIQYDGGTKVMHACPNRMDPITTHIIPEEVSKIEIIKGPYTVRYGATFGGVVNLVTQKPDAEDYGFQGKTSVGYETNGNSYITMLQLQQINSKYDAVGNVSYRNFGNYKDGNEMEIPSSFRSVDYGIKLGYNFNKNERLQAHWRQSFGRDILHAGLPMDTDYDDSSIISLDYKLADIGDVFKTMTAKLYYSYVDHLMSNYSRPTFKMTEATSLVNATTVGGKLEIEWQPTNKEFKFYSGIDGLAVSRDGGRTRIVKLNMMGMPLPNPITFNDKVWQDSYINDFGVFTEAKWFVNPSSIITTGIRYDMVTSDINDPEADFDAMYDLKKRTEHNISATVSYKKLILDNSVLEIAYGRGVRSADMLERFINHFTVGQDSHEYIGNPNLDAEINNQFEIGLKGYHNLNNGFKGFSSASSVYYSFLKNSIVAIVDKNLTRKYSPTQDPVHPKVFQNINDAYKTGFELMAQVDFVNDIFFKTELAYIYSKNKDLNESLPLTPPLTTRFFLGLEKEKYWINAQYNLISKQDNIAESYGETLTKGYQTLDLRLGAKPFNNVTLGMAILNVFDKTYHNHLNFSFTNQADFGRVPITDPGRNLTLFLQYKF
ncbi:MAG: TonB-dependent receptor [Flavobacteriaceae bacterium]|nr:TonB-dependent receptor [Flavobacteriaceae bacterium]